MEETSLKAFLTRWGENVFGEIYRKTVLHGGLIIRSCQGRGSSTSGFFSILKTINLKVFANQEGTHNWK